MKKLLDSIRLIDEFRVLGGEPFLYPELRKVVSFLLSSPKVGRVEIVTNGTIPPTQEIIDLFPNDKLNIFVSNYGVLSRNIDSFKRNSKINATIAPEDYSWNDHGNLQYEEKSEKELRTQYSRCFKDKCVMYEGKLYNCACSAFGSDLHAFTIPEEEYITIQSLSKKDLIRKLKLLKKRNYFTACHYCNWGTDKFVPIKVAEQVK